MSKICRSQCVSVEPFRAGTVVLFCMFDVACSSTTWIMKCANANFCVAVLSENVPLVVSRQLLGAFTNEIKEKLPRDVHKEVATL